ncbi:hypothetical protein E2C01_040502 [Portunus trituberculatus]|uniref:Uncharacterized protein n=1 Tax=Portunus trituberculatus TaxID=210409 RepID=A0A5B7FMP6_PORTR|nr:hypothetical protein [Portunus trituberculatus]
MHQNPYQLDLSQHVRLGLIYIRSGKSSPSCTTANSSPPQAALGVRSSQHKCSVNSGPADHTIPCETSTLPAKPQIYVRARPAYASPLPPLRLNKDHNPRRVSSSSPPS